MSASYWDSTQRRHWLFSKDQLASMRQKLEDDNADLVRMFPLPQTRHLAIYFNQRGPSLSLFPFLSTSFPQLSPPVLCPS